MKTISKIIVWILSVLLLFILVNLIIWAYKNKWVNNYIQVLNEKDRTETMSQVNIMNPVSILSIFYTWSINLSWNIDIIEVETGSLDDETLGVKRVNDIEPYDQDFEDEFNSFFGDEETSDTEIENLDLDNTDNLKEEIDIAEDNTGDTHLVWEELIQKFNE